VKNINHIFKIIGTVFLLAVINTLFAQDVKLLQQEATAFERQLNEADALGKYSQIAEINPKDVLTLVKCTELNCSIGNRLADKNTKAKYYKAAGDYAQKAIAADSTNADANYAMALVAGKMTEIETEKKQLVEYVNRSKIYNDKALAINPNHAKANYIMGKWHFELIHSSWLKKPGIKNFYGGIFDTQVDSAAYYMEKCRTIEPYYAWNYLELAKVYIYDHQPAKALGVLEKLVKLPNRTYDDPAIKEEGKKMLATMQ